MLLLLGPATASAAAPTHNILVGSHRYHTAQLISRAMFPAALPVGSGVVIAPGETFQEALCGAPLAAAYGGPVLLTPAWGLENGTRAELQRLTPSFVFCVGLSGAVVDAVRDALPTATVASITGADVYEMSRGVANALADRVGSMNEATAIVAIGTNFPDAIGVAPLACSQLWPILLTDSGLGDALHAHAAATLSDLGITKVLKVGTYAALPPGVNGVANLSGSDRYGTSVNVANWAAANAGLSFARLAFATGTKFPDALAAGPYLARDRGVLLLTRPSLVPPTVSGSITAHASEMQRISFIGLGHAAIWQLFSFLPVGGPPSTPFLSIGSSGTAVLWLENKLAALSYLPGKIDGKYDSRTYYAMIAFQKREGLSKDGNVGAVDWAKIRTASPPTAKRAAAVAWVEVDRPHQLLFYVEDGFVLKTMHVSTGTASKGVVTPAGQFSIMEQHAGWVSGLWDPCVFAIRNRGEIAIHGFSSVPLYPASHGCVRVTVADMSELFPFLGIGRAVFVY